MYALSRTLKCGLCCGAFICLLLSELLTHFYLTHKNDDSFHIKCGIHGWQNSYRIYNSLCKHVRSKHVVFLNTPSNELSEVDINFESVLQPVPPDARCPSSDNELSLPATEVIIVFFFSFLAGKNFFLMSSACTRAQILRYEQLPPLPAGIYISTCPVLMASDVELACFRVTFPPLPPQRYK